MTDDDPRGEERPSDRVVEQRMRNRVMEYLEWVSSLEDQREYQAAVPYVHLPTEAHNQLYDWVPDDLAELPDVYLPEEAAALRSYAEVLELASEAEDRLGRSSGRAYPPLAEVQALPEWTRLSEAAASTLAVFERRGRLDEEVEDQR